MKAKKIHYRELGPHEINTPSIVQEINLLATTLGTKDKVTSETLRNFSRAGGIMMLAIDMAAGELVVGVASIVKKVKWNKTTLDLEDVAVHPGYLRRGIATALLRALFAKAYFPGCRIDLTTSNSRTAAIALYERLGFKRRDTFVYRLEMKSAPEL